MILYFQAIVLLDLIQIAMAQVAGCCIKVFQWQGSQDFMIAVQVELIAQKRNKRLVYFVFEQ
jgi:hypothetical protein